MQYSFVLVNPCMLPKGTRSDESVAFAAHYGLRRITGQDIPPIRREWESWLKGGR